MSWGRLLLLAQGGYYFLTGLWALVSIETFQMVTGPKTDLWLVKTVGALVIALAIPLVVAARHAKVPTEIALLGLTSAAAFAIVELYYGLRGIISPVYLADAALEVLLVAGWLAYLSPRHQVLNRERSWGTREGPGVHHRRVL